MGTPMTIKSEMSKNFMTAIIAMQRKMSLISSPNSSALLLRNFG